MSDSFLLSTYPIDFESPNVARLFNRELAVLTALQAMNYIEEQILEGEPPTTQGAAYLISHLLHRTPTDHRQEERVAAVRSRVIMALAQVKATGCPFESPEEIAGAVLLTRQLKDLLVFGTLWDYDPIATWLCPTCKEKMGAKVLVELPHSGPLPNECAVCDVPPSELIWAEFCFTVDAYEYYRVLSNERRRAKENDKSRNNPGSGREPVDRPTASGRLQSHSRRNRREITH